VQWDKAVQKAVINTKVGPTISSRAYGMLHTAIYDAWSAYEGIPISTQLGDSLQRPQSENTEANKIEAISYAAYNVLVDLFPSQTEIFNNLMTELGFDSNNVSTDTTTPVGIGNVMAATLLEFHHHDGSNQLNNYADNTGYEAINQDAKTIDIERWTEEFVPIDAELGTEARIQSFLTAQWGNVLGFALEDGSQFRPVAPQPFLLVENARVDLATKTITLENGSVVEISRDIIGTIINPEFIAQAEEIVEISANLTDQQKLIAEFWEDGEGTSFPPGTWMTFGQFVSAREDHSLHRDVKLFFALGNAVFDAGIATWESKRFYDYTRPVRLIRELGDLGLIGEFNEELGGYAIQAWHPFEGTQTILASDFLTYQNPDGDPSPPFAEYTSGHSAFSAAGAEVIKTFTGSDDFGASVTFERGESHFEPGLTPQETVILKWDTFSQAADEAGISRLYGGIHFSDSNINGTNLGRQVASAVLAETEFFINGGFSEPLVRVEYYRFRKTINNTGAYLYVGEEEKDAILANPEFNQTFQLEGDGNPAFIATTQAREDLIPFYRLRSQEVEGKYLFVGQEEYNTIFSEGSAQESKWIKEGLDRNGNDLPAFYVYGAGSNKGIQFNRFRNNNNGAYIFTAPEETENILNTPSLADTFINEGVAFEALV
jgi:hypothetical protein